MKQIRVERDSMGDIQVPRNRLWGAQTQRSIEYFCFPGEPMPKQMVYALALVKRAAASVNAQLGALAVAKAQAIIAAADEVLAGQHDEEFPLSIWQTGSGTQSNMNLNEVLANRASQILGGGIGRARRVHPNDDVNLGQSSNDVFPTAMHVAAMMMLRRDLLPAVASLKRSLRVKAKGFDRIVKIGRTHLQDATPLTLGQEFSGYVAQLEFAEEQIKVSLPGLRALAIGGTAVGTGLNTHPRFGRLVAAELSRGCGERFHSAENKFAALAACDALVGAHAGLKTLATVLFKIANDIRWLASGPRAGLGELSLPENEPGSSIMPGKVNPTQCESMTMICAQVMGNDVALSIGGASGNFELNVYRPLIVRNFLHSASLLARSCHNFEHFCVRGIRPNRARIETLTRESLMLVTALSPHIGYEAAARIAKHAHRHDLTLREAAEALQLVTADEFDRLVRPERMTGPFRKR